MSGLDVDNKDKLETTITRLYGLSGMLVYLAQEEHQSGNIESESMYDNMRELIGACIKDIESITR